MSHGRGPAAGGSRERFLREILARLPLERIDEMHLFPAMRQGGIETGVAVIAATRADGGDTPDTAPFGPAEPEGEPVAPDGPPADASGAERGGRGAEAGPGRVTVYTARYRDTLKGADRGAWEFALVAEADAPLVTVEAVVRGVHRRSGELADAERLTPEAIRAFIDEPWRATTG